MTKPTLVIGAGVIGAAIALDLQRRGRRVILIDRDAPGRGASYGNMASIAVTEFMPASRPSVWRQIPGWLLDPEGPICVRPAYMPRLIPWFWRFLLASRPSKLRELEAQGAALCARALADTQEMLRDLGLSDQLSDTGCLSLYADETEFAADRERIEMLDRFGFDYEVLGHNQLHDLEPEIDGRITKALLLPDNRTVRDPFRIVTELVNRFEAAGGTVERAAVAGFDRSGRIEAALLADGRRLECQEVVLAAGAFTARMAKQLGEPIPLETERGYHTQIMDPGVSLSHSIIWPAKAFMVSPTAGGLRIGGTVEMAGLDTPPDWRRSKITVCRAKEALPGLRVKDSTEWMGHRPAMADTVPVMSASAKTPGVFYATGHGHLGLTYAATTAKLMGQLIAGERPDLDLHPYRINRF
ncbi:NAD(P)/FAD-dependent oxidoreductase [Mameliella alba]|uniref:D-amino acid dehydrogenase small subunit n=1 Tax=Mameliella alba TaxID=561184 RepID=A0A0B3RY20_9RHOB|nr:FAD-binding oxidoreductase [Mameliella alba]KHQ51648.1 D-amino acid dehydrogenase small subunit [Mameliella alba]